MAKDGAARLRLRPVGAADRKKLPEYGPLGTGCPAIERAVAALYKGQNEESFWALMNAINYALELDTRVLVPLEAASDQPDGAAPWAEHPVPAEKAKDLQPWTLRTQKGRCYLPVFTSVKMAEADKGTASRPMAERLLASAMQMALDSDSIDGVVIDPWTSSATLDCSLLNGLLHASHDTDEPGEAELRAGNHAMAEERWDDAMHYYQLSAEEGCAEGLAMMGEMLYEGRGCRKSPAQARKFWKKAADAGDVAAWVALGDDAMVQGKGAGAALRAYRKAQKLCASTPDIAYMPQVCLRVAQYETQYISRKKADAYRSIMQPGELLITADTIVWLDGKVLGKPEGREGAVEMLRSLSGKSHQVFTGVCLTTTEWQKSFTAASDVEFDVLSEEEIRYYVDKYQPMDKAGAYGVQEWIGYIGVKSISGSFYNIMGLPIQKLYGELKKL